MLQAVAATPPCPSWAASGIQSNTPRDKGHAGNEGEQGARRALRILIVEDEMFVAMDAEAILTGAGHEVVGIAPSADDAVSSAAHLSPDVVFMDVRLQGHRDGIDAAGEIRSRFDLPVIFVTANVDPVTHARAMQVSPLALVSKPFTSESLLGALKSLTGS